MQAPVQLATMQQIPLVSVSREGQKSLDILSDSGSPNYPKSSSPRLESKGSTMLNARITATPQIRLLSHQPAKVLLRMQNDAV